jgi:NADPH:quinone reductase-like Zn-dependent oxidoreductase
MKQIWTTRVGRPETLVIKEAAEPTAAPGEIKIKVKAAGLNFADIMARLGLYPDAPRFPTVMGYEVSGEVMSAGPQSKFKAGDRVIGLCRFGGQSEVVVLPEIQVLPAPAGLSFAEAAALPVNYLTAYQMLIVMGSLKKADRVLVHSAGGGVGLAVMEIIKIIGAEAIGTASAGKHAFLKSRGYSHLIDYRQCDFEAELLNLTGGQGVQLALDPVGGESWAKSFRCLSPTGRLVVFGFSSAANSKRRSFFKPLQSMLRVPWIRLNPLSLMNENKAVVGVNLGHLWNHTEMTHTWMEKLLHWVDEGKIRPVVAETFRFAEVAQAHHFIQDRKNVGKVILVP